MNPPIIAPRGVTKPQQMTSKIASLALILTIVTAAGFTALNTGMIGSANATSDGDTYATVTALEGASQNGQVDEIHVNSTGYIEWENMPDDVEYVKVRLKTNSGPDKEWQTFAKKKFTDVPSDGDASYSYDRVGGDVIANTDFDSDTFSASEDGETQKRYFPVKIVIEVVAADGETCIFVETHKLTTKVSNLEKAMVSGETKVDGDIKMNETDDDFHCPTC